jgi:inorganic triphosphatase YgiF
MSVLEPAFETVVTRTWRQLHTGGGDLELALEEGVVRAGDAQNPLCEAELELKSGAPECLLDIAAKLFAGEPVRLSQTSRAERGYGLALGQGDVAMRPARALPVELSSRMTCAAALAGIVQSAIRQIEANRRAVLETEDPEAAHQLRIGLRRLRSALRAFRPLEDAPAARQLEHHAQALARIVGRLRDADILIDDIYAPVAGMTPSDAGFAPLRTALLAHRARTREEARAALAGQPWSALQLYLALWPRTIADRPALAVPVGKFADKALRKCWKKVARLGTRLEALSPEQKHDMRKALKTLRYTAEFFVSLYPARATRTFLREAKALQDVFGYANDVASAASIAGICHDGCPESREAQRAAGYVLGWHTAEAQHRWRKVEKDWRRLAAARFWD